MTNEAIEAAARAITKHTGWPTDYDNLEPVVQEALRNTARAVAPALMEEGARLALEAAAKEVIYNPQKRETYEGGVLDAQDAIRALDPAAIVKGAGDERD